MIAEEEPATKWEMGDYRFSSVDVIQTTDCNQTIQPESRKDVPLFLVPVQRQIQKDRNRRGLLPRKGRF